MKKKPFPIITAILLTFAINTTQGQTEQTFNLESGLWIKEKFYTTFLDVQRDYNDIEKNEALKIWKEVKNKEVPGFTHSAQLALKKYIGSPQVIDWASHYQMTGQYKKSAQALSSYFYSMAWYIYENYNYATIRGLNILNYDQSYQALQAADTVDKCLNTSTMQNGIDSQALQKIASNCFDSNDRLLQTITLAKQVYQNPQSTRVNQTISLNGFISGNKIEHLTENYYEPDFIQYIAPMTSVVQKKYSRWSIEDFKNKMPTKADALRNVFTTEEGFPAQPSEHRIWDLVKTGTKEKNIYGQIFKSISNAQESIFIDLFFIGGSTGVTLAKNIIQQVQAKPNLRVYILNDRNNPMTFESELAPAYNYLRAYSEKFPEDRIILLKPRIDLKRTALPALAESIINDQTLKAILSKESNLELKQQLDFYPKAKSDHSKVVIIDGLNQNTGVAFVGSKNFTDSSGSIAHDEVTRIEGPAVPAILDSYYYDLVEALRESLLAEPQYLPLFAKSVTLNVANSFQNNNDLIQQLLTPVDVLNRNKKQPINLNWKMKGNTILQIGENNVYGTIRSALVQYISYIRSAQRQIIISDQFLYDPYIVTALQDAIRSKPNLRVYILISPKVDELQPQAHFSHVPNISYIENLVSTTQVQIRWKVTPKSILAALSDVQNKYQVKLMPEYHPKTLSVDGVTRDYAFMCNDDARKVDNLYKIIGKNPVLISGSANKDVMTLTGGFREFQIAYFDKDAVISHDCQFWNRFLDPVQSSDINEQQMNLPPELSKASIDGRLFNQIIRNVIDLTYNAVSGYFD